MKGILLPNSAVIFEKMEGSLMRYIEVEIKVNLQGNLLRMRFNPKTL